MDQIEPLAHDGQVLLGILAILATLAAILTIVVKNARAANEAAYHAQAANQAVNNRGPGEHSLWDQVHYLREDLHEHLNELRDDVKVLVQAQTEFSEKGWNRLPPDLGDAPALTQTIRELQRTDAEVLRRMDDLTDLLREHDAWERKQKWPGYQPGDD